MQSKLIDVFVTDDSIVFNFGTPIIPDAYKAVAAKGKAIFATDLIGNWRSDLASHRFDEPLTNFVEQLATTGCDTIEVYKSQVRVTAAPTGSIGRPALAALTSNYDLHPRINYVDGRPLHATVGFQGL